jgi:acyl transferase domain-containing protein
MIIEDPPIDNTNETDPRGHHVVTVSGRTVASFEQNRERLLEFVKKHDADIANTAYTTTARRQHHVYKRAYSVRSTRELATVLEKDKASMPPERVSKPKASFIFTGQGSHYSAMGKQLFDTNSRCRQWFTEYNSMCIQQGFQPFLGLIKGELDTNEASPSQIQLAIVSVELVFLRLWESWGVEPDAVLGHSLGEYAALVAADVLSAWDALYLVGTRAKLMERNCTAGTHLMLALKLPAAEVVEILDHSGLDSCEIACINGPQSTVVSGAKEDIATLQERFTSKGVKTITLSLPFAFHSGQMDAILDEFKNATRSTHYSPPNIPVASPLTGNIIKEIGIIDAE